MAVVDFLVVGQGLAGTVLAWRLRERGARVLVIDREEGPNSSRVAGGLITPITGRQLAKSWRIDESWPVARSFYREMESRLGCSFFHELPVARIFRGEEELSRWTAKRDRPEVEAYLSRQLGEG